MELPAMKVRVEDGLARLTFTEPSRGNPIDGVFCASLCEAAILISEDPSVRCLLIDAEGKVFSYGGDVGVFVSALDRLTLEIKRWTTTLHSAISRFQRMNAPVVAAVHSVCAGGMSGFVAGSDVVIAADDAKFVAAYAGIGFSCDAGSSVMYSRRMGLGRARKFLLMNETLTAPQAHAAGLVDEVVPRDQLQSRALAVAQTLAAGPTRAFGEMRRLFASAGEQPLETQLELEALALARCAATEDARHALVAFSRKQTPKFQGK
jgi:2-(1,2-epoxy-1,2-dihydrophenyl)acetyl-CoA isomerase